MKISKSHQKLSNDLNNPRVLENPEEFLGPNWMAILNFWLYVDTLKNEQWNVIVKRYWDMSDDKWGADVDVAIEAAKKTTPYWDDIWCSTYGCCGEVTLELIGAHELLNQQKPLTFIPLFLNP